MYGGARAAATLYPPAMVVTLLGSGGFAPSAVRETACALVRDGPRALLLDAGSGVRRLVTDPWYLEGVTHVDVVLTHFHLDHVCGLPYLCALPSRPRSGPLAPGSTPGTARRSWRRSAARPLRRPT